MVLESYARGELKVKITKGLISFTKKEVEYLVGHYNDLRKYTYKSQIPKMDYIVEHLKSHGSLSPKEWNEYMMWRQPKGTPVGSFYMVILDRFFKLRTCESCNGTGHDPKMNVCHMCHGSGANPKIAKMLKETSIE